MRKVCFKVVRVLDDGIRYSCFSPSKYAKYYDRGAIVRANEGTLGLMVFKLRYQAEDFKRRFFVISKGKILRIEPIGRGKTPKIIVPGSRLEADCIEYDLFYDKEKCRYRTTTPPAGTICYPAVKVLD